MSLEELQNYLRIRGLKVNGRKNELVASVFAASENSVKPIKTTVDVEKLKKKKCSSQDRKLQLSVKSITRSCYIYIIHRHLVTVFIVRSLPFHLNVLI